MNIQGLQKLTLLDYPGKLACTIFTAGCNLRCPFCHNASIVLGNSQELEWSRVMEFLRKRVKVLDGVCISGGEPTLQRDLEARIGEIKELGFLVKLDTNGTRPKVLKHLVQSEFVDYVAMDIKNSFAKYGSTVGISNFDIGPIQESVEFLLSRPVDYEFRTTVVKEFHEKDDFVSIGTWLQGAERYYLQAFVDSEHGLKRGLQPYSKDEMEVFREILTPFIPAVELRGV
jgi:pyruvate formate lyase activating enzyme